MKRSTILISGSVIIIAVFVIGVVLIQSAPEPDQYEFPSPEDVVHQYFTAWNNKDWPEMYATISDGFKKIEPTAKDLASFRSYAESQAMTGVKIINIKETSNYGTTASVDYSVEFNLINGTTRLFSGAFTLKFREGDVIKGWKLIHPYGQNIDTS